MEYRLAAIDLDDTLLSSDLTISEENKEAVKRAVEQGKMIVISTGRMYKSALPFARQLGVNLPLITYQGALVKDSVSGEVLVERPVPEALAREVLDMGYKMGMHINLYFDDNLFVDSITEEGLGYANLARVELNPVGDLRKFLKDSPTKILLVGEPAVLDDLLIRCRRFFGEELYITKSKSHFLEFMHPEANKGRALAEIGRIFDVSSREMIAIGDSYNDLDMIQFAGLGVAMGNAPEEIKRLADYITVDNESGGVAVALHKFLLRVGC